MKSVVTFGEVLARLSPAGVLRFRQIIPGRLNFDVGGAEANVAASLAQFGLPVRLVTALPRHAIADACMGFYAGLGVDTSYAIRGDQGRLGLYFYENGANQRSGQVIYDREFSTISLTSPDAYDWERIFVDMTTLFVTGITPGLSEIAAEATIRAAAEARARGLKVVCDLNFRRKLWTWRPGTAPGDLAREVMPRILEHVDLLIANDGSAADVFGIEAGEGTLSEISLGVARALSKRFPKLSHIAMTLRESLSASHNNWGAMLYEISSDSSAFAPLHAGSYAAYEIKNIVDRVGAGDAFAAGLIFALNTPELSAPEKAIAFAVAASCLSHSIVGDVNFATRSEVEALISGGGSGRVQR